MTEDQIYKVIVQSKQRLITMPQEAEGYYIRRVCQDGAVTFLPVKMPEHGRIRDKNNPEEMPK